MAKRKSALRVGDVAVCPPHGVAEVVAIEDHELLGGTNETFYRLEVRERGLSVMIPARKAADVGLREVISVDEAKRVFRILRRKPRRPTGPWPRMCRELSDKLTSGSIFLAAEVLRDLHFTKVQRELSATAQRILDKAHALVVGEVAAALGREHDDVAAEVLTRLPSQAAAS